MDEGGSFGRVLMIVLFFIVFIDIFYFFFFKGCSNVDDFLYYRLDE